MNVRFNQYVDSSDAVKLDLVIFVVSPVAHFGKIFPVRIEFLVA